MLRSIRLEQVSEPCHGRPNQFGRRRCCRSVANSRDDLTQQVIPVTEQDVFLRGEVAKKCAFADICSGRNFSHGDLVKASLDEYGHRRALQALRSIRSPSRHIS